MRCKGKLAISANIPGYPQGYNLTYTYTAILHSSYYAGFYVYKIKILKTDKGLPHSHVHELLTVCFGYGINAETEVCQKPAAGDKKTPTCFLTQTYTHTPVYIYFPSSRFFQFYGFPATIYIWSQNNKF
jgi:hypothetical protein